MMYDYQEVKHDDKFKYGVVTYLNGEDEAVTAEGYVKGTRMRGNDESIVAVVDPERTLHVPFGRIVKIHYPIEE